MTYLTEAASRTTAITLVATFGPATVLRQQTPGFAVCWTIHLSGPAIFATETRAEALRVAAAHEVAALSSPCRDCGRNLLTADMHNDGLGSLFCTPCYKAAVARAAQL